MNKQPHNVPEQLNIYTLDVDSDVTNYGKHNRLIVFGNPNKPELLEVREDIQGLPLSTEDDRQRVLRGRQRQHKRGTTCHFIRSEQPDDKTIFHHYTTDKYFPFIDDTTRVINNPSIPLHYRVYYRGLQILRDNKHIKDFSVAQKMAEKELKNKEVMP